MAAVTKFKELTLLWWTQEGLKSNVHISSLMKKRDNGKTFLVWSTCTVTPLAGWNLLRLSTTFCLKISLCFALTSPDVGSQRENLFPSGGGREKTWPWSLSTWESRGEYQQSDSGVDLWELLLRFYMLIGTQVSLLLSWTHLLPTFKNWSTNWPTTTQKYRRF